MTHVFWVSPCLVHVLNGDINQYGMKNKRCQRDEGFVPGFHIKHAPQNRFWCGLGGTKAKFHANQKKAFVNRGLTNA